MIIFIIIIRVIVIEETVPADERSTHCSTVGTWKGVERRIEVLLHLRDVASTWILLLLLRYVVIDHVLHHINCRQVFERVVSALWLSHWLIHLLLTFIKEQISTSPSIRRCSYPVLLWLCVLILQGVLHAFCWRSHFLDLICEVIRWRSCLRF